MKLTKNRLKQIIKEEIEDLDEQNPYVVDRMSSTEYANKFIGEPLFWAGNEEDGRNCWSRSTITKDRI